MLRLYNNLQLQSIGFWLLTIAGLLIALNWHVVNYDSVCLIFWGAALYIAWRDRTSRTFDSNLTSTTIGILLITWVLFRSNMFGDRNSDVLTYFYPLASGLGICLLATKVSQIKQYWQEILIISFSSLPLSHLLTRLSPDSSIAVIDAKVSRLILWYVGFDVQRINNTVYLPTGGIEIEGSCSSFGLLWLMWQFCVVIYLCFTVKKSQKILLAFWATVIALVVNGIRLCLLAFLVANEHQAAFGYWHGSSGAAVFTNIAVICFGLAYWWLTREKRKPKQDLSKLYEL